MQTPEEHMVILNRMRMITHLVNELELDEFIRSCERADTLGPIVDPTLWREGHDNLNQVLQLAQAFQQFQAKVRNII